MSSTVRTPQAVFWDMDGTLVDTEPHWIAAEHELVQAHGGTWSPEQAQQLVGQELSFSAEKLQQAGVELPSRQIIDQLLDRVIAGVQQQMPWRPGALELLESLHAAGVRCALVTMSEARLARQIIEALPADAMEFVVAADMVSRGKPDPEAYHLAFAQMAADHPERTGEDLARGRCLAIEDSVPGTAAAADSGLVTLAVPHMSPLPASDRWHVLPSLRGLDAASLERLMQVSPARAAGVAAPQDALRR